MSTKYMWPEQRLELDSLLNALSTAVAVLAMECEKYVSTILEGFLKYWMYMRQRIKHYFKTILGPWNKKKITKPKRKHTFGKIQNIVRTQSDVQTTRPHMLLNKSLARIN